MARIGQILSESVPLTDHDVEEILNEQKTTRQRFGDAALALGKARPEQVWNAWLAQLGAQPVDLSRFTPDPAAMASMPSHLALRLSLVPLRIRGNELVVAAANDLSADDKWVVERDCGVRLVVALSTMPEIDRALALLYPAAFAPAA